ncbi:hypothetical protein SLS60_008611 [Paraconiothyrium brasiliense]|uniref:Amidohydrolase-related domain-containing protein n=1 Tax=Paraconiothyrium brasiliense TaxID=300254 RepID=A0ABR3QYR3_9PLEO
MSTCGWQLPQGGRLNTSSDVFSMTSMIPSAYGDMPHSTLIRLIFMGTELHDVPDTLNVWAKQCSLQACVKTLSSSVVNGTLQENVTHTITNQTVVDTSSPISESEYDVYIKGESDDLYMLGMGALLSIRGWFGAIFTNGSATRTTIDFTRSVTDPDRAVVVNLTVGISSGETFFDTDIVTAFYWNYYEDSHIHIIDPERYAMDPNRDYTPKAATVKNATEWQQKHGISHSVIVLRSVYGTNNSVLIDALNRFNGSCRSVVVVDPENISNNELAEFHTGCIRGVRVNYGNEGTNEEIVEAAITDVVDVIPDLGVRVVLDHYGHAMAGSRTNVTANTYDPYSITGFSELNSLVQRKLVFLKISAPK